MTNSLTFVKKPLGPYTNLTILKIKRPTLGLALSGGGARGFAQIGVLQELERRAIQVDYISGTSIGAIIGGLYAVGYSATEIESLATNFKWDEIIRKMPQRHQLFMSQKDKSERHLIELHFNNFRFVLPSAYSNGQAFTSMLTTLIFQAPTTVYTDFRHLHVPFNAVATDLISGNMVVLKSGSLVDAMRASMAIPLLFTPIQYKNMQLVDGGLTNNLPCKEVRSMGADLVLAVDTSSPLHHADDLKAPWIIADQVTTIMMKTQVDRSHKEADWTILPKIDDITNLDFDKIHQLIQLGRESANEIIPAIEQKLFNPIFLDDYSNNQFTINVQGLQNISMQQFNALGRLTDNDNITWQNIHDALGRAVSTGWFKDIETTVDTTTNTIIINITENPVINKICFSGNEIISDSTLNSILAYPENPLLNSKHLKPGLDKIIKNYRTQGYGLASFDSVYINGDTLKIDIFEGMIHSIDLLGIYTTKPFVVFRETTLNKGKLFKSDLLKHSIDNIYSTGYFDEVRFQVSRNHAQRHLFFNLKEKNHGILRLGLRYDSERQISGFFELAKDNLLGYGIQGTINALAGHRDLSLSSSFSSYRLYKSYLTFSLNMKSGRHRENYYKNQIFVGEYDKYEQITQISIGQQMGRLGTLSLRLNASDISLQSIRSTMTPHEKMRFICLTIRSEVDTRDRRPFTKSGMHHYLEYETSGRWAGSENGYTRLESLIELYHSTEKYWTLHHRLHWGTSDLTTPFYKQFKLGGFQSYPALPENALVGRRFLAMSAEIRCDLQWPKWLKPHLSFRGDLAGAWLRYEAIKAEDFNRALTAMLGIETIFGPLYFSYSRSHKGNNRVFLSIGHTF
ncbi:patatin-like phospholipase family protein [bacterium]|nr:patatin-like phospholipase family protein [bacterium]